MLKQRSGASWQKTEYDIEAVKLTVEAILTGRVKVELQQLVDLA